MLVYVTIACSYLVFAFPESGWDSVLDVPTYITLDALSSAIKSIGIFVSSYGPSYCVILIDELKSDIVL